MNAGLPLAARPAWHAAGAVRLVGRAWQRRSVYGLLAVLAVLLANPLLGWGWILVQNPLRPDGVLVARLLNASLLVAALSLADAAVVDGARPLRSYAMALLTGAVLGALLQWHVLEWFGIGTPGRPIDLPLAQRRLQMLYALAGNLMVGALLSWLHVEWRSVRRSAEAMRRALRERLARMQEAETARLLALQSRVEPQWLFDTLTRIRALWRRSPEAAAALLDELIASLRSAMPPADLQSTLGRELALVQGQLRVRRGLDGERVPALAAELPVPLAQARFAPLVLWPLLQWLAGAQREPGVWRLQARREPGADAGPGRLRLTLQADTAEWPAHDDAVPALLRARLQAVHGPSATLAAAPATAGGMRVELCVDFEEEAHGADGLDR